MQHIRFTCYLYKRCCRCISEFSVTSLIEISRIIFNRSSECFGFVSSQARLITQTNYLDHEYLFKILLNKILFRCVYCHNSIGWCWACGILTEFKLTRGITIWSRIVFKNMVKVPSFRGLNIKHAVYWTVMESPLDLTDERYVTCERPFHRTKPFYIPTTHANSAYKYCHSTNIKSAKTFPYS